jgi:hypothetical protein
MRALIETKTDGSVAMRLDAEAARAMLASVVFASRFHVGIAPLARIAEEGLRVQDGKERRSDVCL